MAKIHCVKCGAENDVVVTPRFMREPELVYDRGRVVDLARAIRSGNVAEAEYHLDRLIGDHDIIRHWIEIGRACG